MKETFRQLERCVKQSRDTLVSLCLKMNDVMNWSTTSITSFGPPTLDNAKRKPIELATRDINSVKDIDGASSNFKYNKYTNKPSLYDTSDVEGSKPRSMQRVRNVMDKSLYVDDIDGARTFIKDKMLRTGRHVDPLQPSYDLPSFMSFDHRPQNFLRNTLDVSDVDGAQPKIPKKFAPRDSMPNDIEGAQACWRPRHRRARLEAPPVDTMNVADITAKVKPIDKTMRRTNPIDPGYKIYGMDIVDNPKYTKPKSFPKQIMSGHLLRTDDINTASKHFQPHMRREFRNLTSTADIVGAQADTVVHSIQTKRETNPLAPTYQALDQNELLEPPILPLMPSNIITRPTIRPNKETSASDQIQDIQSKSHHIISNVEPTVTTIPTSEREVPVPKLSNNKELVTTLDLSKARRSPRMTDNYHIANGSTGGYEMSANPSPVVSGRPVSNRIMNDSARSGPKSSDRSARVSARERRKEVEREAEIQSVRDL
jgi:hypothetical protein